MGTARGMVLGASRNTGDWLVGGDRTVANVGACVLGGFRACSNWATIIPWRERADEAKLSSNWCSSRKSMPNIDTWASATTKECENLCCGRQTSCTVAPYV